MFGFFIEGRRRLAPAVHDQRHQDGTMNRIGAQIAMQFAVCISWPPRRTGCPTAAVANPRGEGFMTRAKDSGSDTVAPLGVRVKDRSCERNLRARKTFQLKRGTKWRHAYMHPSNGEIAARTKNSSCNLWEQKFLAIQLSCAHAQMRGQRFDIAVVLRQHGKELIALRQRQPHARDDPYPPAPAWRHRCARGNRFPSARHCCR